MGKKLIHEQKPNVSLFDLGVLMQISMGTWSGRKMLTREDFQRVGIDIKTIPEDVVNLGRKLLVPKEEVLKFNRLEQQARGYLSLWSIPFGVGRAAFVPIEMVPEIEARLTAFGEQFYKMVDDFILNFETMKAMIAAKHPDFWQKCLSKHYPATPELLREKFYLQFFSFKVAGVDGALDGKAQKRIGKLQAEKEQESLARITMKKEVERFVEEAVNSMRAETVRFCDLVMARVNGTPYGDENQPKKLVGRSLRCFREYVERFRQMNVFGDEKVEKMLTEFRENYLDGVDSPTEMQTPQMSKAITEHLSKLRELAAAENGDRGFLAQAKRRIEL